MVEHGPCEEEGEIEVDVEPRQQLLHLGQLPRVVVHRQVRGQEGAELKEVNINKIH